MNVEDGPVYGDVEVSGTSVVVDLTVAAVDGRGVLGSVIADAVVSMVVDAVVVSPVFPSNSEWICSIVID